MRVVDLFSGCGGLSLGFQNAGHDVISAYENWDIAVKVYRDNFTHPIHSIDLGDFDEAYTSIAQYEPEIIIGGPPCQDFSSAGKRDEEAGRADLTVDFANIVVAIQPNWFVMENVPTAPKSKRYKKAIEIFKSNGYGLTLSVLDSSFYEVPQIRKRAFLIGNLGGKDDALLPYLSRKITPNRVSVREYFESINVPIDVDFHYRHPRSYKRRGIFSVDEPSPTVRGVNRPIPKNYKRHPNDATDPNGNVRPLTTIERSYLQTFPQNFRFEGTKTNLETLIGNAVPVKLAEFVARSILDYESGLIDIEYVTQLEMPLD